MLLKGTVVRPGTLGGSSLGIRCVRALPPPLPTAETGLDRTPNAELSRAIAQNGFQLRIAVQALGHCAHAVGDALRAPVIAAGSEAHALSVEAAPG